MLIVLMQIGPATLESSACFVLRFFFFFHVTKYCTERLELQRKVKETDVLFKQKRRNKAKTKERHHTRTNLYLNVTSLKTLLMQD